MKIFASFPSTHEERLEKLKKAKLNYDSQPGGSRAKKRALAVWARRAWWAAIRASNADESQSVFEWSPSGSPAKELSLNTLLKDLSQTNEGL